MPLLVNLEPLMILYRAAMVDYYARFCGNPFANEESHPRFSSLAEVAKKSGGKKQSELPT